MSLIVRYYESMLPTTVKNSSSSNSRMRRRLNCETEKSIQRDDDDPGTQGTVLLVSAQHSSSARLLVPLLLFVLPYPLLPPSSSSSWAFWIVAGEVSVTKPCRCLCFGTFEQTTYNRPRRLTILHASHNRLMAVRTFIFLFIFLSFFSFFLSFCCCCRLCKRRAASLFGDDLDWRRVKKTRVFVNCGEVFVIKNRLSSQ